MALEPGATVQLSATLPAAELGATPSGGETFQHAWPLELGELPEGWVRLRMTTADGVAVTGLGVLDANDGMVPMDQLGQDDYVIAPENFAAELGPFRVLVIGRGVTEAPAYAARLEAGFTL